MLWGHFEILPLANYSDEIFGVILLQNPAAVASLHIGVSF